MRLLDEYYWVALLACAVYLLVKRRGPVLLVLALPALGIYSFVLFLEHEGFIESFDYERFDHLLSFINVCGILALIIGIIQLSRRTIDGRTVLHRSISSSSELGGERLTTLFIPRNTTNSHTRAEQLRDTICDQLTSAIKQSGVECIVQKSNAFSSEVWLRIDYQLPPVGEGVTLRAHVAITVERLDFHRFEHTLTVVAQRGTEVIRTDGLLDLGADGAQKINYWILNPGAKLDLPNRVRDAMWKLWLPRNSVVRIRRDRVGLLLGFIWLPLMIFPPLGIVALVACIWLGSYRKKRRPVYVLTSGKPATEPRSLTWLDSWQVTVGGLAAASDPLRSKLMQRLGNGAPADLTVAMERFGYWGVDSRIEREQMAVRYRRALGFVHIVAHGDQLYVGWECHLNQAAWAEETMQVGIDRVTGVTVQANRVVLGRQRLNEYDVADANFLAEWLHESLRGELKLQLTEHKIDQEIDFTVQRESRKSLIGRGGEDAPTHSGTKRKLFSRVG